MRTLEFVVDKQNISKQGDFSGLVAGTKGYLQARFSFSVDWASYRKGAVFTCCDGEFAALIEGGVCKVPDEAAACTTFKVHVVGRKSDGSEITSGRTTIIQRRH